MAELRMQEDKIVVVKKFAMEFFCIVMPGISGFLKTRNPQHDYGQLVNGNNVSDGLRHHHRGGLRVRIPLLQ